MKKIISLVLAMALMLSVMPVLPAAAAETETTAVVETTAPVETAAPTEETTAPTEETTVPTEETTAPTEETTVPTEETTAPTEAATAPTEETTVPTEETTVPTETATEPVEETTVPTEEAAVPANETSENLDLGINALSETPAERTIETDEYGIIHFQTFEDLKHLMVQSIGQGERVDYQHDGEYPLVIAESITIPEGRSVEADKITVPKGVTFTVSGHISAKVFQVDGVLNLMSVDEYGGMMVSEKLAVSGAIECGGNITLWNAVEITGIENIHRGERGRIEQFFFVYDMNDWKIAFSPATENSDRCVLFVYGNITLEESAVLSKGMCMDVGSDATLHIPSGCTLELGSNTDTDKGHIDCYGSIVVEGALVNNRVLNVREGGTLEFSGGFYSGGGTLEVYCDGKSEVPSMLPGLDLSAFEVKDYGSYCRLVPRLGTPTELKWGYRAVRQRDESGNMGEAVLVESPGSICWKPAEPFQGQVMTQIFKQGEAEAVSEMWTTYRTSGIWKYRSVDNFVMDSDTLDSGTYYFTVTQIADGTEYSDSETAVSEPWTYTKPEAKLGACENLTWNWPDVTATAPENAGGIEYQFYFSPTGNQEDAIEGWWGYGMNIRPDGTFSHGIWDEMIQENGSGYYYFKVRALSSDITKWQNGPWSELSPAYNLTDTTQSVDTQLDTLIQDTSAKAENIKQGVQDIGTDNLKDAMLADQSGTAAVAKIQELEERAGTKTVVEVTNQAAAFDQSKVTIVGAGLNDVQNESEDIKLIVDKPEKEHVLPAQYNNSVAVSFSMDLNNIKNTEDLKVPVKITMPVPKKINPDFLVILHYHPDGSHEKVIPFTYRAGDGYYASFVLTSFSDFVMVQEADIMLGDLNGDGKIAAIDAAMIYAAVNNKKVLTDAEFKAADVDGSGKIQAKDAAMVYAHVNNKLDKFPAEK